MKKVKFITISIMLCFLVVAQNSFAQEGDGGDVFSQSTDDMFIVLGSAGAGAVLGLSTLSFVDVPGDHLKNIIVGAAIGTIIGVGVVAFQQAGKSRQYYEGAEGQASLEFSTKDRYAWHQKNYYQNKPKSEITYFNYIRTF